MKLEDELSKNHLQQVYKKIIDKAEYLVNLDYKSFNASKNIGGKKSEDVLELVLVFLQSNISATEINIQVQKLFSATINRLTILSFIDAALAKDASTD